MPRQTAIHLDPRSAGAPFPRIHEGRYEVDLEATGLTVGPLPAGLEQAVKQAGVRLLRVGMGCWLPGHEPDPSTLHEREWFRGTTLEDTQDPSQYDFTHLDRMLEVCRSLEVELLFNFDHMPASLARPGKQIDIPLILRPFVPKGYTFPDGVRNAPAADPDVYAAACVRALEHIDAAGVTVRYVELWNEPDLPFFYSGTYEEWFAMYRAFAPAIRAAGHRVGGPSWAGALARDKWLVQFLRDCRDQQVPLDFYSFHRYDEEVDKVVERCREVRAVLDEHGFAQTEALLDEWGYDLRKPAYMGTVGNAAFIAACLMQLPDAGIDAQTHILLVDPIKDVTLGRWHGLTRADGDVNPIFHCMVAFERFQSTPRRIPTGLDDRVLAGVDDTGTRLGVVVANPHRRRSLHLTLDTPRPASGTIQRLTSASFEAGGMTGAEPITLTSDPMVLTVEPESMVVVDATVD